MLSTIFLSVMNTKVKITFAPGCFDNFEGTQEELDQLVNQITEQFGNMTPEEIVDQSSAIDIESMFEDYDEETVQQVLAALSTPPARTLN